MTPFSYQRGETISLALDAVSGDPASAGPVTAQLKAVPPGRTSVPPGAPVAAVFSVSSRAATPDFPAGWTLTIPASASIALPPGTYLADARIEYGGGVVITDQVALRLREPVTAP
jgi:hypothetical protein